MTKFGKDQEKDKCLFYYKAEAKEYDARRFSCECSKIHDQISKNIVYNYLKNCSYVLDVGTGTGRFAIYLAKKGIDVVAMDSSNEMVLIAREKSKCEGCEKKTHFIIGDVENLPFKLEVFDGVCSIYVLVHFVSRDKIIPEFSRVVKNGGIIVFDVPNEMLSKGYWIIMNAIGKTTFRDYHYDLKEIKELFLINSMEVTDRTKFVKIPRFVLHFLICILKLKLLTKVVEKLEKYNFGATSIIEGRKRR